MFRSLLVTYDVDRDTSDLSWPAFIHDFGLSIRSLTGLDLEAKASRNDQATALEEEIELLRSRVEELGQEVSMKSHCLMSQSC